VCSTNPKKKKKMSIVSCARGYRYESSCGYRAGQVETSFFDDGKLIRVEGQGESSATYTGTWKAQEEKGHLILQITTNYLSFSELCL
jgi:hypothetical protein